jgi:hypothetical protein
MNSLLNKLAKDRVNHQIDNNFVSILTLYGDYMISKDDARDRRLFKR